MNIAKDDTDEEMKIILLAIRVVNNEKHDDNEIDSNQGKPDILCKGLRKTGKAALRNQMISLL